MLEPEQPEMRMLQRYWNFRVRIGCVTVAAGTAAFLRGNWLLGAEAGFIFCVVTAAAISMLAQARSATGRFARAERVLAVLLAAFVATVVAAPTLLSPRVQSSIDQHRFEVDLREAVRTLLVSDPEFAQLTVTTMQLKVLNVTISGRVPTADGLQRLRTRLQAESPSLQRVLLHLDVTVAESGDRFCGVDKELFPASVDEF